MHHHLFCLFFLSVVSSSTVVCAATLTVDRNGGADYRDIQSAIDAAKDGDTVLVKSGEYTIAEPINFNRLHDPKDPASSPVKNIVLRSEAGPEATKIRMSDPPARRERASVVIFENSENASRLVGFTIQGGWGTMVDEACNAAGGGICCVLSSPVIENCMIIGNSAGSFCLVAPEGRGFGGGVFIQGDCAPSLVDCTISLNQSGGAGGGVALLGSSATLRGCKITRNVAMYSGGGAYLSRMNRSTFIDCTIVSNRTAETNFDGNGGGVYCREGSSLDLERCTLAGNWANYNGGAIYLLSDPDESVSSCTSLTNCLVFANCAYFYSAIDAGNCDALQVFNCTFYANTAREAEGIRPGRITEQTRICNCIFWVNEGGWGTSCTEVCENSCLSSDPLFVKEGTFDFTRFSAENPEGIEITATPAFIVDEPDLHLRPDSPVIDAGTTEGAPATDIEGHLRSCGKGVDLGAYEFGDCAAAPAFRRGDANGDGTFDLSDPILLLGHLFLGGKAPTCLDAADADDSGRLDLTDAIYSLSFQFMGGPPPASPFPGCGLDPTIDGLGCSKHTPCE